MTASKHVATTGPALPSDMTCSSSQGPPKGVPEPEAIELKVQGAPPPLRHLRSAGTPAPARAGAEARSALDPGLKA
eukprot:14434461-Alexandrium_andersonii.AAC.1